MYEKRRSICETFDFVTIIIIPWFLLNLILNVYILSRPVIFISGVADWFRTLEASCLSVNSHIVTC